MGGSRKQRVGLRSGGERASEWPPRTLKRWTNPFCSLIAARVMDDGLDRLVPSWAAALQSDEWDRALLDLHFHPPFHITRDDTTLYRCHHPTHGKLVHVFCHPRLSHKANERITTSPAWCTLGHTSPPVRTATPGSAAHPRRSELPCIRAQRATWPGTATPLPDTRPGLTPLPSSSSSRLHRLGRLPPVAASPRQARLCK